MGRHLQLGKVVRFGPELNSSAHPVRRKIIHAKINIFCREIIERHVKGHRRRHSAPPQKGSNSLLMPRKKNSMTNTVVIDDLAKGQRFLDSAQAGRKEEAELQAEIDALNKRIWQF